MIMTAMGTMMPMTINSVAETNIEYQRISYGLSPVLIINIAQSLTSHDAGSYTIDRFELIS